MIKITEYSVHESAMHMIIRGMRNSWDSWEKGDSELILDPTMPIEFRNVYKWYDVEIPIEFKLFKLGEADRKLALNLIQTGPDHGKFLRQIHIVMDIEAPEYWWLQFDQYKIGTTSNSTSTMHTLGKYEIEGELFCLEDVDKDIQEEYLNLLRKVRAKWVLTGKKRGNKEWRAMCQLAPRGLIYKRTMDANYQVLRNMYHARKHHKLDEWHQFCTWIETLPYSEFITVEKKQKRDG